MNLENYKLTGRVLMFLLGSNAQSTQSRRSGTCPLHEFSLNPWRTYDVVLLGNECVNIALPRLSFLLNELLPLTCLKKGHDMFHVLCCSSPPKAQPSPICPSFFCKHEIRSYIRGHKSTTQSIHVLERTRAYGMLSSQNLGNSVLHASGPPVVSHIHESTQLSKLN